MANFTITGAVKFSGLLKVAKDFFTGIWEAWTTENWEDSNNANWEDLK